MEMCMWLYIFVSQLKDLKRQLHAERKRAERLQAKLQELLSEGNNRSKWLFVMYLSTAWFVNSLFSLYW